MPLFSVVSTTYAHNSALGPAGVFFHQRRKSASHNSSLTLASCEVERAPVVANQDYEPGFCLLPTVKLKH